MAFAIYVKTESSDIYVYAFDGEPTNQEINARLLEELGEEYDYISETGYDASYEIKFKLYEAEG